MRALQMVTSSIVFSIVTLMQNITISICYILLISFVSNISYFSTALSFLYRSYEQKNISFDADLLIGLVIAIFAALCYVILFTAIIRAGCKLYDRQQISLKRSITASNVDQIVQIASCLVIARIMLYSIGNYIGVVSILFAIPIVFLHVVVPVIIVCEDSGLLHALQQGLITLKKNPVSSCLLITGVYWLFVAVRLATSKFEYMLSYEYVTNNLVQLGHGFIYLILLSLPTSCIIMVICWTSVALHKQTRHN